MKHLGIIFLFLCTLSLTAGGKEYHSTSHSPYQFQKSSNTNSDHNITSIPGPGKTNNEPIIAEEDDEEDLIRKHLSLTKDFLELLHPFFSGILCYQIPNNLPNSNLSHSSSNIYIEHRVLRL